MPDAVDRIFLRRTYELAERGRGNTAPNPCVGAVVARETVTLGEGFHRARGLPHAEVEALEAARRAGYEIRGATLYVSLEPCAHEGTSAACTRALLDSAVKRVVIGTRDPNPVASGGVESLRDAGVEVDVADDEAARAVIEDFAAVLDSSRPYLTLKMATSLDGYVAPALGWTWLTGEAARAFVRDLRIAHDAVLVGAGTVRIDDPQLTVRPARLRKRPYRRIVACETGPVPTEARIFTAVGGYEPTIILAPTAAREQFAPLEAVAEVIYAGDPGQERLDLREALSLLRARGVLSILCEGGPTLAAELLAQRLVDRIDWLIAPRLLANERAIPVLAHADLASGLQPFRFDRIERLGDDVLLSARLSAESGSLA